MRPLGLAAIVPALVVLALAGTAAPVAAQAPAGQAAPGLPPFDTTRLYRTEAEFTRAIAPYQQAVQARAQDAAAQYWLGFAYLFAYRQWLVGAAPYAAGYLPRAERPLTEAIRLDPQMVRAYVALHDVYHLMGDSERADQVLRQMLERTRPGWLPAIPAPGM